MRKNIYLIILILIIIPLLIYVFRNKNPDLKFVHPEKKEIISSIYGLGYISAARIYHLKLGVMSMIKNIHVEEGQEIKTGDSLVDFDSIPPIKSPISGVVTLISYKVNEVVFPQMNVLTVMDLGEKYITLSLEEQSVIKIKKGQSARIVLEAIRDKVFKGEVTAIYPGDNQFIVKIISNELPAEVLPGMTADVAIEIESLKDAIVVPISALNDNKIRLKKNGKIEEVDVKIGSTTEKYAVILDPILNESDEIAIGEK